jgi:hypothetical protein
VGARATDAVRQRLSLGVRRAGGHASVKRCAASVDRPTDASVALEHGTERSGPCLLVRQTRACEASDASDAGEFDRWLFG